MAAFFNTGYAGYATSSNQWLGAGMYYSTTTPVVVQWPYWVAVEEPVDALALARRALAAVRTFAPHMATVTPSRCSRAVYRLVPRRTVVARGYVSWVQAGTRRPL